MAYGASSSVDDDFADRFGNAQNRFAIFDVALRCLGITNFA